MKRIPITHIELREAHESGQLLKMTDPIKWTPYCHNCKFFKSDKNDLMGTCLNKEAKDNRMFAKIDFGHPDDAPYKVGNSFVCEFHQYRNNLPQPILNKSKNHE